jgi:hypothetical protein
MILVFIFRFIFVLLFYMVLLSILCVVSIVLFLLVYTGSPKRTRTFSFYLLLYLQLKQTCLLQSTPLYCWYTAPSVFFQFWNASWNVFCGMARRSCSEFSFISSTVWNLCLLCKLPPSGNPISVNKHRIVSYFWSTPPKRRSFTLQKLVHYRRVHWELNAE